MDRQAQMRDYLTHKINPVFERLIVDLLIDMPEDFVSFAVNWLQSKGKSFSGQGSASDNNAHKQAATNVASQGAHKKEKEHKKRKGSSDEEEEEEEDDFDEAEMLKQQAKLAKMKVAGQRGSVSAEVYGSFNKKENFKAKVIPKTEEQRKRIQAKMEQAFMFSVLDDKERDIVIGAMEECRFKPGDTVIKQGDPGELLYVIDEGNLDCFKKFTKDAQDTYLKTYQPGEAFGELALLYNAPRAATIIAKTDCLLWSLDRECFNIIVKDAARKKREAFEDTLNKVTILEALDPYEKSRLGDGVQQVNFQKGQMIITEGQKGDNFYIVQTGTVSITKAPGPGQAPAEVKQYNQGDYFGEVSLIHGINRQANAVAKTDVQLIYLDADKFKRLLSPIFNNFKSKEKERYGKTF